MSRKSKQHIVPRTYLRSFCDHRAPEDWAAGRPFTPALWVHTRALDTPPKRAAPHNVAWARDVYTLRDDDPEHPWLEEALGRLESSFGKTIARLRAGKPLSHEDQVILALFVGALHERTIGILRQRQQVFDDLAHISRQFEDAAEQNSVTLQNKDARDRFWERFGEEAKRQLANSASEFAKVTGPHSFLIENTSPIPFITSDSPTTYRQIHADELLAAGVPADWLLREIPRSERQFFVFCPLTPRYGFLASPFFLPVRHSVARATSNVGLIFRLNEFTRFSADQELYASTAAPYGQLLSLAKEHDRRRRTIADDRPSGLAVYSSRERYWLPTSSVSHGTGDHPLIGRLRFRTTDLSTLKAMANDNDFAEITVMENGSETGGMRGAWFTSVALDAESESIIENDPVGRDR